MANTLVISSPNPKAPIKRLTSEQRLVNFNSQASTIYSKFSPYDGSSGGLGFNQPFVYTSLNDSNTAKNLTKYDTQAFPIGSTVNDLKRVGKFMTSGTGLLFIGKQYLLQKQNAFNETRIYNPLSVLGATAKPASLGQMDRPKRYIDSGGTLLGTFVNALKGTIGMDTTPNSRIIGTATGDFSNYVGRTRGIGSKTGKWAGVLRFETANSAITNFNSIWEAPQSGESFSTRLMNTFRTLIPSTDPQGLASGGNGKSWEYRPEYPANNVAGPYTRFLASKNGLLSMYLPNTPLTQFSQFYNGTPKGITTVAIDPSKFHRYKPKSETGEDANLYAPSTSVTEDIVGDVNSDGTQDNLAGEGGTQGLYKKMLAAIEGSAKTVPQQRMGAHMYDKVEDYNPVPRTYPNYKAIPSTKGGNKKFEAGMIARDDTITLDYRGFSKARNPAGDVEVETHDTYNAMLPLSGNRGFIPNELVAVEKDSAQSKDIIFFYFFDLINNVYLPFRATVNGLSEQNSADWEDITYMGRADKQFVYKGFSRDMNLSFSVYANSVKELIPMWKRINYLVGLTRPAKYTGKAVVTNTNTEILNDFFSSMGEAPAVTGNESQFIYPPMVTLRLGDLYYDQPCVISSISVNIPDDTNWESYRGDEEYSYIAGPNSSINLFNTNSRQLPLKADISMTMKLLEKSQSMTTATDRWGIESPISQ